MKKGIIYYTDNNLDEKIMTACQNQLRRAFSGETVSVSLQPIDFGTNIVMNDLKRSYPTMIKQILTGLKALNSEIVFFTEHDVLYHPSHFDFYPVYFNYFFYNTNNWRWDYPNDRAITYETLTSLSMLCCYRDFAIRHYEARLKAIEENNLDEHPGREPEWARRWGYEPGLKKPKRGGFSNDLGEYWRSTYPNIDIRHNKTFSRRKVNLEEFKHKPDNKNWTESRLGQIPGWNWGELKKIFNI